MALGGEEEPTGDLLPAAEDLDGDDDDGGLAAALCGDSDFGFGDGDASTEPPAPIFDEVGELPDGLAESALTESEDVDLSKYDDITVPQARRVAQLLAQNTSLSKVKLADHELDVSGLEEDELEWDSEEYGDVVAVRWPPSVCISVSVSAAYLVLMYFAAPTYAQIIVAELLKSNSTVVRLDLARNEIGDAGACALAEMLCTNTAIEYLNLESNQYGERGVHLRAAARRPLTRNCTATRCAAPLLLPPWDTLPPP